MVSTPLFYSEFDFNFDDPVPGGIACDMHVRPQLSVEVRIQIGDMS